MGLRPIGPMRGVKKGKIIWLTGNSEAGKSTISRHLYYTCERIIILDGDRMRETIARELRFTKDDREILNIRIAKLAGYLATMDYDVIVASMCPYQDIRDKVVEVLDVQFQQTCKWVYLRRDGIAKNIARAVAHPYFPPENPDLYFNTRETTLEYELDTIIDTFGLTRKKKDADKKL